MTPCDILIAARAKIEKPENWTQGAYARDADGEAISVASSKAVCWCAKGAIFAVAPSIGSPAVANAEAALCAGAFRLFGFNDSHTHAEVLALFDRAIEGSET